MVLQLLKTIDTFIERFSLAILVLSLALMLTLSFLAICFRWGQITCLWIDPVVRHLVLLSAFLGGVLASGTKEHIGIDLLSKYIKDPNWKRWIERPVYITVLITLIWMMIGSFAFVSDTFVYEGIVMLGIHRGYLVTIIPIGLGLMAYRFFYLLMKNML